MLFLLFIFLKEDVFRRYKISLQIFNLHKKLFVSLQVKVNNITKA